MHLKKCQWPTPGVYSIIW